MHVFRSMIHRRPRSTRVWAAVRAFDGVAANWNPGVDTCQSWKTASATATGTLSVACRSPDGTVFRETLLAHSDTGPFLHIRHP